MKKILLLLITGFIGIGISSAYAAPYIPQGVVDAIKVCAKYSPAVTQAQNNVNNAQNNLNIANQQQQECSINGSCAEQDYADNQQQSATTQQQSAQNTLTSATQVYQNCLACAPDPKSNACIAARKSFSCESIFAKHEDARVCNRNRCIAEKGYTVDEAIKQGTENSCNCKYGKNGDGKDVGIPLNTSIPFVGRCVPKSSGSTDDGSALNAFPVIISAATKMLVTVILLVSFVMIVVGGVQWASGDAKSGKAKITKVAIGIAMLGMMGAILRLINPNFFK